VELFASEDPYLSVKACEMTLALVTRKPAVHLCVNKTHISPLCVSPLFCANIYEEGAIHLPLASAKRKIIKHEPGRAQGIRFFFTKPIMGKMGLIVPSSWLEVLLTNSNMKPVVYFRHLSEQ
jgi:hypothetical protein